jgi:hypothetical protein
MHYTWNAGVDVSIQLQQWNPDFPDAGPGGYLLRDDPRCPDHSLERQYAAARCGKEWLGVSRGHWEGNTLVVETTNVKQGAMMVNSAMQGTPQIHIPTSGKMKIVERFTRINNDYLIFEITVDDPVVLRHSWIARFPLEARSELQVARICMSRRQPDGQGLD